LTERTQLVITDSLYTGDDGDRSKHNFIGAFWAIPSPYDL